jgi:hypothetical protein
MKPKLVHQEAMEYSFKARQAIESNDHGSAFASYQKAAQLESQVAEFYFDKPDLEPTRSIVIRSAAFLNIKAGQIEEAKRFIFFGLLNATDVIIKEQLNNALELAVSFGNMPSIAVGQEFNYINLLRQRSVHYVIEPSDLTYGHAVSLKMINEFTDSYLKSIKAFACAKVKGLESFKDTAMDTLETSIQKLIDPLVTSTAYGSFKFAIANDNLSRDGEPSEVLALRANIIQSYHNEIFTNPLTDDDIAGIKKIYSQSEVNEIFRPLSKIKANNATYKVGYYDLDDFNRRSVGKIINKQRKKLLTINPISQDEIGELESLITHNRISSTGRLQKTTIRREQMTRYEYSTQIDRVESKDFAPLLLNEEIMLNIQFDSNSGFTISFDDLNVTITGAEYGKALIAFQEILYKRIKILINSQLVPEADQNDLAIIKKLITNPDALSN